MDLLQTFLGCMYPSSIKTESIESIDSESADFSYQVANIDENGEEVSSGQLKLTEKDLVYLRAGRHPTSWPIGFIRRYGCSDHGNIFLFEAGRRCPTGEAIFAFRVSAGADLVERLKNKIDRCPPSDLADDREPNEDRQSAHPIPLSYALIDFGTTKALNESAQAHAASRAR